MSADPFFDDLKRYGGPRALRRDRHRERVREFVLRQRQLAATGGLFIVAYVVSDVGLFAALAALMFSTATPECRRMRACGRYWQCKRSIEVIGI